MTMDANELRALADALSRQRQADEHGIYCAVPRQAVDAAIKYLRAQADAQPVAWMHPDGRVVPAATMDQAYMDGGASWSSLRDYMIPLYTRPAPAAPQAEPIDPHMILAEDRFPDVPAEQWVTCSQCDGDFDRECPICDGLGRVLATDGEQAEPKRGPTCLWSRADDDTDVWETSCGHAFTIIEGTPSDNHMEFCCYCGRRVDEEIGGSDE